MIGNKYLDVCKCLSVGKTQSVDVKESFSSIDKDTESNTLCMYTLSKVLVKIHPGIGYTNLIRSNISVSHQRDIDITGPSNSLIGAFRYSFLSYNLNNAILKELNKSLEEELFQALYRLIVARI